MVCHSLLQWPTFSQTSPPWPIHLGWPYMAWLSFIELDKAVFHVIQLASCLWLLFQCVCPLMPFLSSYHLSGVSLTLDVGYLFTAAPAKRSRCSLLWTWGISQRPPLLTLDVGYFLSAACCSSTTQTPLRLQQYVNRELPDVQVWLEKAEEPEIKLPTSAGSSKKQESSRKTSISA